MNTPKGEINDKVLELTQDEKILEEMAKAESAEACYDLVKDRVGISFEEFMASMKVASYYTKESESGLLNDDDLEQVAGGKSSPGGPDIRIKGPGFFFGPVITGPINNAVLSTVV